MRILNTASMIVLLVGVTLFVGSAVILENLNIDADAWLFAVLGLTMIMGPVLVGLSVAGFILSAALVDRRMDQEELLELAARIDQRNRVAIAGQRVAGTSP